MTVHQPWVKPSRSNVVTMQTSSSTPRDHLPSKDTDPGIDPRVNELNILPRDTISKNAEIPMALSLFHQSCDKDPHNTFDSSSVDSP